MAHDPDNYRDVKLLAGENNSGFILEYDEMGKRDNSPMESRVFLGTRREVFDIDEGAKALAKLMLFSGSAPVPTMSAHTDES